MSFLSELRAALGPEWDSRSDEEILSAYADAAGMSPGQVADLAGYRTGGGTMNRERLSGSIDRYQSGLYDVGRAAANYLGAKGLADTFDTRRRRNEFAADVAAERASALGSIDSYKDVDWLSPSSVGNYALGLGIQALPYSLEFILPGTAARMGLRGTQAARAAAIAVGDTAAASRAAWKLRGASLGTGVAASYPSSVGDIMSSQREQAGTTDDASAFALGVPYAALNLLSPIDTALAQGRLFRSPLRALDNVGGWRGVAARTAATGLRTGVQEGLNEVGQEAMNQLGRMQVDPTEAFLSDAARNRFAESFVGGAVLGGTLGAGAGGWRRNQIDLLKDTPQATDMPKGVGGLPESTSPSTGGLQENKTPLLLGWEPRYNVFPDGTIAALADDELAHRYGLKPQQLWDIRNTGTPRAPETPRIDPEMAGADLSPGAPRKLDLSGEAAPAADVGVRPTEPSSAPAENPGLQEIQRRILESRAVAMEQAAAKRAEIAQAIARKKEEFEAAKARAVEVLGNMKMGSRHVELFMDLERQRNAGLIDEEEFINDAALLSRSELGRVKKLIEQRDAAQAEDVNKVDTAPGGANDQRDAAQVKAAQSQPAQAEDINRVITTPRATNEQPDVPGTARGPAGAPVGGGAVAGGSLGIVRPAAADAARPVGGTAATAGVSGPATGTVAVEPAAGAPAALTTTTPAGPLDAVQRRRMTTDQLRPIAEDLLRRAGVKPDATRLVKRKVNGKMVATPRTALDVTIDMLRADDMDTALVEGVTGIDFVAGTIGKPLTLDQATLLAEQRTGKKISKQAAQARLAKYGIDPKIIEKISAVDTADTVSEAELGLGQEGAEALPGFRVDESLSDAAASGVIDVADGNPRMTRRAAEAAQQWLKQEPQAAQVMENAQGKLSKSVQDKQAVAEATAAPTAGENPQYVEKRRVLAAVKAELERRQEIERQALAAPSKYKPGTVQWELRRALDEGNITEGDIAEARDAFNEDLLDTDPTWDDLTPQEQAYWTGVYIGNFEGRISDREYAREWQDILDSARQRITERQAQANLPAAPGGSGRVVRAPAAAQGVQEGDDRAAPQVLRSAGTDAVALDESLTRAVRREEMARHPAFAAAVTRLQRAGLGHILDWVSAWRVAPSVGPNGEVVADGWVSGDRAGNFTLTLREDLGQDQTWVTTHELGHIADMAPYGGAYSSDARLQPGGEIYNELDTLYLSGSKLWSDVWEWPFNAPPAEQGGEIFANLFAAYTSPGLRPRLQADAPLAFAFIQGAVRAIQAQNRPSGDPFVETQIRRRAAQQFVKAGVLQPAVQGDAGAGRADQGRQGVNRSVGANRAAEADRAVNRGARLSQLPAPSARTGGIRGLVSNLFNDGLWRTYPSLLGWMSGEQLADRFKNAKGIGPAVKAFSDLSARMAGRAMQIQATSDALLARLNSLRRRDPAGHETLSKLLLQSSELRMWPNKEFRDESKANDHIEDTVENRAAHARLRAMWNSASSEVRALYEAVIADHDTRYKAKVTALRKGVVSSFYPDLNDDGKGLSREEIDRIAEAKRKDMGKLMEELGTTKRRARELRHLRDELEKLDDQFTRMPGPYFPLMRFGDHVVSIKSQAFQAAERALIRASDALRHAEATSDPDADLEEERKAVKDAQAAVARLKASGDDYRVVFFETIGEAREYREMAEAQLGEDYEISQSIKDQYLRQIDAVSPTFMRRLERRLAANFEGEKGDQIRQSVREMYIEMLPENSMMKATLKRATVAGYSDDVIRVFSASAIRDAHGISRLEFQAPLRDALDQLRFDRANVDAKIVGAELARRLEMNFRFERHPVLAALTNVTYMTRLGLSPSFLLTNLSQPWFVSAPIIAARHHFKTIGELRRATVAAVQMLRFDWKDQKTAQFQFNPERAFKAGQITEDEMLMLKSLLDSGRIDITITQDLGVAAQGEAHNWLNKATQMMGLPAQQLEVLNRVSTALAAYRLERQLQLSKNVGNKEALQAARDYADRIVGETHLNYAAENRARHMHPNGWGGWGRVMWQFRSYQQGMIYLVLKNLIDAAKGDKEARRASYYLAGTMLASAGVSGLPGAATVFFVAQAIYNAFKDDDDEKDLRQMFYAGLEEVLGTTGADMAMKGSLAAIGLDISQRVGMGDIFSPVRFGPDHLNPRDQAVGYFGAMVGGAALGVLADYWKAANLAADGEFARAAQTALPKVLSDQIRWGREMTQGVTDSAGRVLVTPEERDFVDALARAAGIPTVEDARRTERRQALFEAREKRDRVRNQLLAKFARARLAGEPVTDILDEINEFNARHYDARITPASREAAVRSTRIRSMELRNGVPVRKRDQQLAEELGI